MPWGKLLPKLEKAEPGKDVVLDLKPKASPALRSTRAHGVQGSVVYEALSSVVEANGSKTYTHTLEVDCNFNVSVYVNLTNGGKNATLIGNVTDLSLGASVTDCKAPIACPMSSIPINLLVKTFGAVVTKLLNRVFNKGIPLTGGGGVGGLVTLVQPTVFTEDGYITVATDFAINPPSPPPGPPRDPNHRIPPTASTRPPPLRDTHHHLSSPLFLPRGMPQSVRPTTCHGWPARPLL